jgi:hypothetical protein
MKKLIKIGRWEICYTIEKGKSWWYDTITIYTKEEIK